MLMRSFHLFTSFYLDGYRAQKISRLHLNDMEVIGDKAINVRLNSVRFFQPWIVKYDCYHVIGENTARLPTKVYC